MSITNVSFMSHNGLDVLVQDIGRESVCPDSACRSAWNAAKTDPGAADLLPGVTHLVTSCGHEVSVQELNC